MAKNISVSKIRLMKFLELLRKEKDPKIGYASNTINNLNKHSYVINKKFLLHYLHTFEEYNKIFGLSRRTYSAASYKEMKK